MSLRVLILTQYLDAGGLERMAHQLGTELRSAFGVDAALLAYDREGEALPLTAGSDALPVIFRLKGPRFCVRSLAFMATVLMRRRIRLIHTHDIGPLVYASLLKLLSFGSVHIVHTQHSFVGLQSSRRGRLYERILPLFADRLVTVSEHIRSTYQALGVWSRRIEVIENGAEFAVPSRAQKQGADVRILYLARIHRGKGQLEALEVWDLLDAPTRKMASLTFVGQVSDPQYGRQFVSRLERAKDRDRIHAAGGTTTPRDWLSTCDVLLSCSHYEGMPLAPLEAIGSGLAALLSDIPGHARFESAASFYPVGDLRSAAARLGELIAACRAARSDFKAAAWAKGHFFRQHFSLQRMTGDYLSLYVSVIGR